MIVCQTMQNSGDGGEGVCGKPFPTASWFQDQLRFEEGGVTPTPWFDKHGKVNVQFCLVV